MYQALVWVDHQIDPTRTYTLIDNGNGTITLTPYGDIIQQGTSLDATNFNNIEGGVLANDVAAMEAMRLIRLMDDAIESLGGFTQEVTLTNSSSYPFNDSEATVAFASANVRFDKDYTVIIETESYDGGFVGDIVVSDKMLNGFKLAYTGSATSVAFKCYIQGGR